MKATKIVVVMNDGAAPPVTLYVTGRAAGFYARLLARLLQAEEGTDACTTAIKDVEIEEK